MRSASPIYSAEYLIFSLSIELDFIEKIKGKDLDLEDEMNEPWSWAAPFLFYAKYLLDTDNLFNTIAFFVIYDRPF